MIDMLTRHAIQVLRQAGHDQRDVATLIGVGVRTVRRVDGEPDVIDVDTGTERERRGIGRPAKAEPFRPVVAEILAGEPDLLSVEILRRVKLRGYTGGKTALYELIAAVRPTTVRPLVRFEGLPGEDYGECRVMVSTHGGGGDGRLLVGDAAIGTAHNGYSASSHAMRSLAGRRA